jgi:hypothetical protein
VGIAYAVLNGDPSTPGGLLDALSAIELVPGRASIVVRALTPVAKLVQRARGNGRVASTREDRDVAGHSAAR